MVRPSSEASNAGLPALCQRVAVILTCLQFGLKRNKSDYLDFDFGDNSDDLADIKDKYEDFLRQEKTPPSAGPQGAPQQLGYTTINRRRSLSSKPYDRFDTPYDDYDDEYEDERSMPPRETDKRYMNGKHILTNREIT